MKHRNIFFNKFKDFLADIGIFFVFLQKEEQNFTPEDAARRLQDKYLDQQIYFGTPEALELLKKTDVWKLS